MCDTLVHRGPDDVGTHHDGLVGLGTRRLAVIDIEGGRQPMANGDASIVVTCNGEIYNFRELRAELECLGHVFRSASDTEVVVHAYEEWGDEFVSRLNGMFAIAILDRRRDRLLLVRDHIGIKPLYYAVTGTGLVWGSEIKALLASGLVERELDLDALRQFLAWEYCPGGSTLFRAVRKLLPAHLLVHDLRGGTQSARRYWRPEIADSGHCSDRDWIERVDETLRTAVRRQLVADVPLGSFLSGGVDSSLVTAAMGDAVTFSIGFEDPSYNELQQSKAVADHLGVRHVTRVVRPDALDLFDRLMHFMDDPIGDSSIFPTFLVSELARREVTVSLSGDGGDELFAGYETYRADRISARYGALPHGLRATLIEPAIARLRPQAEKKGTINKLIRFVEGMQHDPALGHARWRCFLADELSAQLFSADARSAMRTPSGDHVEQLFGEARGFSPLSQSLYVDTLSYLPDNILTKLDRMSMAVSLESRVPFLDRDVVDLAFEVPDRLKLRGTESKWILKKVAERYVPLGAVYRPKEGFSAPLKHWIAGTYRRLMQELLSADRIERDGVFDWPTVDRLRHEHLEGFANHSHQLWSIMVFQAWKERWLSDGK